MRSSRTSRWFHASLRFLADASRGGIRGFAGLLGRGAGLAWHYRAHRDWVNLIQGDTTAQLLDIYPRIVYRHSTSHLFEGTTWSQRLVFLRTHYSYLNDTLDRETFAEVLRPGGLLIWQESACVNGPSISLVGPCLTSKHREGELGLEFSWQGSVLYKLAFSIVRTSDLGLDDGRQGLSLFIGQVQGGRDCRLLIRKAAKLCLDNAPRDLLMSALEGIAAAWDVDFIIGVAGERSLCHKSCQFDHNAFWMQYGGLPGQEGHYVLPLPFRERPMQASSAAHRRRTRRKRHYKEESSRIVATHMRTLRRMSASLGGSAPQLPGADLVQFRVQPRQVTEPAATMSRQLRRRGPAALPRLAIRPHGGADQMLPEGRQ